MKSGLQAGLAKDVCYRPLKNHQKVNTRDTAKGVNRENERRHFSKNSILTLKSARNKQEGNKTNRRDKIKIGVKKFNLNPTLWLVSLNENIPSNILTSR